MNSDLTIQRQIDLKTLAAFSGLLGPTVMLRGFEGNLKAEIANVRHITKGAIEVLKKHGHNDAAKGLEDALEKVDARFKTSEKTAHQSGRTEASRGA